MRLYLPLVEQLNFKSYLVKKKIDPEAFAQGQPEHYREFEYLFGQVHPESFTAQKLFLINRIRRAYPLKEDFWEKPTEKRPIRPKAAKPKVN